MISHYGSLELNIIIKIHKRFMDPHRHCYTLSIYSELTIACVITYYPAQQNHWISYFLPFRQHLPRWKWDIIRKNKNSYFL